MPLEEFSDRELLVLHRMDQAPWDEDGQDPYEADDPIADNVVGYALGWPLLPVDAAVPAPPGFELVGCDATPRHPAVYVLAPAGGSYPAPCPHCQLWAEIDAHRGCEHAGHGRWRRWRVVRWAVGQLYASGLSSSGGGVQWGGGCDRCLVGGPSWRGARPYVLWVRRWTWRCLRAGHRPAERVAFGFCSKCLPCPDCGSSSAACLVECAAPGRSS